MKRKMMKTAVYFMFIMLAFSFKTVFGQFSLDAELRSRAEYRHGLKSLVNEADKAAFFVSQRSRLNAAYGSTNMRFGLSVQDIRVWGDQPQLVAVSNQLMLHQAWGEIIFNDLVSLKIGRQELVYDDSRILGNVDWAQQARSHDIALLKFEKKFKLHIGAAFNQQTENLLGTEYTLAGNYKTMQFVWFHKKFEQLAMSLLFLNNGLQHTYLENGENAYQTVFNQTIGGRFVYTMGKTSFNAATYYTIGKDANDRKLNAYYLSAGAQYMANENWTFGTSWELLSGTSQKEMANNADYTIRSLNPFYGTNHKLNGFMDYFYVGNHLNNVGLSDLVLNGKYSKNKLTSGLAVHFFAAAADVFGATANATPVVMPKSLGTEFDLTFGYQMSDEVILSAGYSQMFGTETLQLLKGGDEKAMNNWAWVMLSFKPKLIK